MEQKEQGRVIEKSINGCSVTLSFLRKPDIVIATPFEGNGYVNGHKKPIDSRMKINRICRNHYQFSKFLISSVLALVMHVLSDFHHQMPYNALLIFFSVQIT